MIVGQGYNWGERLPRILVTTADVTADVLALADEAVEWFEDEDTMPTEDFLDRMFKHPHGTDLEDYDNPAARAIMRHARKQWRDTR